MIRSILVSQRLRLWLLYFFIAVSDSKKIFSKIDLLIERNDNVINMCEMKFYRDVFVVNKDYYRTLLRRQDMILKRVSPRIAVHSTLVTTFGLKRNEYSNAFNNVITLDDLFS